MKYIFENDEIQCCGECPLKFNFGSLVGKDKYGCYPKLHLPTIDLTKKPKWCPLVEIKEGTQ